MKEKKEKSEPNLKSELKENPKPDRDSFDKPIFAVDSKGRVLEKNPKKKKTWTLILLISSGLIILGIIIFLLFKAFGLGKWDGNSPIVGNPENTNSANIKEAPKDHESPLTGNLITKNEYDEISKRRPLAVIIENHSDARPQSGLNDADIVWEALAEGGISRFMPVYLENSPDKVGPVRSLRKYFLDWVSELRDGLIMHVGYADTDNVDTDALGYVYTYDIKSLALFTPATFWRASDRSAPHDAYTSVKDLWLKAVDAGWTNIIDLDEWQFKENELAVNFGTTKKISFNWSSWGVTDYSVNWAFDPTTDSYLRDHNGIAHLDAESGDPISAQNVILQVCNSTYYTDSDDKTRLIYDLFGEGPAYVFRDGQVISGTWKKESRVSRTKYFDAEGAEILFNRGRTWISVLPTGSEITY